MTEPRELLAEEEDEVYRPRIEEILGHEITNEQFESMAWIIVNEWELDVMEGPKEHREKWDEIKEVNNKYTAYLLRNDLNRAKWGDPYPRPTTERMRRVWPMAKLLYTIDDPSGFLGPALGEMIYVARAVVLTHSLGIEYITEGNDFSDVVDKIDKAAIWPARKPDDDEFYKWVQEGGLYAMFEHRGDDYVDDNFMAQPNVQAILP